MADRNKKKKALPAKKTEEAPVIRLRGRPSAYTDAFADYICDKIASSDKGLQTLLEQEENMPHPSMCYRWLHQFPYFREKYTRAREQQADYLADKIIEIASTPIEMIIQEDGVNGYGAYSKTTKSDAYNHRRLLIDAMKWKASKLAPQKYGDKVDITSDGKRVEQTIIKWGEKEIQV